MIPADCASPLVREPLSVGEAVELAGLLRAVADPVRLRLLSLIGAHAGGEACVCELTGAFEISAPTISHHLRVLREAGLIGSHRRGSWVYYRIVPDALAHIGQLFTAGEPAVAGTR